MPPGTQQEVVADENIGRTVRLQLWFGEKRKRHWVVDGSRRASVRDVWEESNDTGSGSGSGSDSDSNGWGTSSCSHFNQNTLKLKIKKGLKR